MKTTTRKGFTLIEMAVVLLIIGILAGIVLRNIGGFNVQARDQRKVADLQLIGNYLAQYYANKGHFPPTSTFLGLQSYLTSSIPGLRSIPGNSNQYYYTACATGSGYTTTTNPNHFILKVILEQTKDQASGLYENGFDGGSGPAKNALNWECASTTFTCYQANKEFCYVQ